MHPHLAEREEHNPSLQLSQATVIPDQTSKSPSFGRGYNHHLQYAAGKFPFHSMEAGNGRGSRQPLEVSDLDA